MTESQDLGKELKRYTNADTFPVSITFLKDKKEIPEGTRTPLKNLKVKMAHCQAQAIARKYGWSIAMTREDLGCAISGQTYGWEQADRAGAIKFLMEELGSGLDFQHSIYSNAFQIMLKYKT